MPGAAERTTRQSTASKILVFFFNDTPTTEIYTLSYTTLFRSRRGHRWKSGTILARRGGHDTSTIEERSEEHTSELQSQSNLVCRLLLEKKKNFSEHNLMAGDFNGGVTHS